MSATVTLLTDRPSAATLWRAALGQHDVAVEVLAPARIGDAAASAGDSHGVIVDASVDAYNEDELLWALGYLRASGARVAVHAVEADVDLDIEEIADEICEGLFAREEDDITRVSGALVRRADTARSARFEFVTLAPSSRELLTILGDGACALLPRPLTEDDDGSRILSIELAEDAGSATLVLEGDRALRITARDVAAELAGTARGVNGVELDVSEQADVLLNGAVLGKRLKELRLEAGLTQAELAKRTGIHRPNIARVEAGRHTPSLETLSRLTVAIGVPATRVFSKG